MNYRSLGKSGLKVSEVSLGGWLTHGRTIDDAMTASIVHRAFDLGINLFDTADIYNRGEAEKALAKAIQSLRREDLVVATKCFWPMTENVNDKGLSKKHIYESINASLKRLQLDYIDLYQFHRFDPETPIEESVRAVDEAIRQGKILYWGISEWEADQIEEAVRIARDLGCNPPVSDQPQYNMLQRKIEPAIGPTCQKLGMGMIVFSPMAQGVLTGKYAPNAKAPEGSRGADEKSNVFMSELTQPEVLERVQKLKQFAEKLGIGLAEFALAWCLRTEAVSSVIVGATRVEQLEQNAKASEIKLEAGVWEEAERIVAP